MPECLICFESVTKRESASCIRCNIHMHDYCFDRYMGHRNYTKCPHCQRIGVIGIMINRPRQSLVEYVKSLLRC